MLIDQPCRILRCVFLSQLSVANLVRLKRALFPPSRKTMESLYRRGFDDASRFLLKENWFE